MTNGTAARVAWRVSAVLSALFMLISSGTTGSGDANVRYRVAQQIVSEHDVALDSKDSGGFPGRNGRAYSLSGIAQSLIFAVPEAAVQTVCSAVTEDCATTFWKDVSIGLSSTVLLPIISGVGLGFLCLFLCELGFSPAVAATTALLIGTGSLLTPYAKFHQEENQVAAVTFAAAFFCARFQNLGRSGHGMTAAVLCWVPMWFRGPGLAATVPLAAVLSLFAFTAPSRGARRMTLLAVAGAGAVTIGWLLFYNWYRFGGVGDTGYVTAWRESGHLREGERLLIDIFFGLIGPFVHPSKSLFIYSPLILLGITGAVMAWSDIRARVWVLAAVAMLAISVIMPSPLTHWGGDNSWGPRYQVAAHSLLLAFSAYVWNRWPQLSFKWRVAASSLAGVAIAVQLTAVAFNYNLEYARGQKTTWAQQPGEYQWSRAQLVVRLDSLVRFHRAWITAPPSRPATDVDEYMIPAFLPWKLGQRFGEPVWSLAATLWLVALLTWIAWSWRLVAALARERAPIR